MSAIQKLFDLSSNYEDYTCTLTAFQVTDDEVRIYIDMKAPGNDYILPPSGSILFHEESGNEIPFVREEFSYADPKCGFKGFLAFDKAAVLAQGEGNYSFRFSCWSDYSVASVFLFDGQAFGL